MRTLATLTATLACVAAFAIVAGHTAMQASHIANHVQAARMCDIEALDECR